MFQTIHELIGGLAVYRTAYKQSYITPFRSMTLIHSFSLLRLRGQENTISACQGELRAKVLGLSALCKNWKKIFEEK
jgi:hypothetical protein